MAFDNSINELSPGSPENPGIKTAKDFYQIEILRLDKFPESPKDLPNSANIPVNAIGELENAILKTTVSGKETSQKVFWSGKSGFKNTQLYVGKEDETSLQAAIVGVTESYFGDISLLAYHAHPEGDWHPSNQDVSKQKGFPRDNYISLTGSNRAIIGLFKTAVSLKLPFENITAARAVRGYLKSHNFEDVNELNGLAGIIEKLGLGLFYWLPEAGQDLKSGDLQNGLPMIRAIPN